MVAEVDIKVNDMIEPHLVVIEDKAYTMIHDNQLTRYKQTVEETYGGTRKPHYWVMTFVDKSQRNKYEAIKMDCDNANWELLSFYNVIGWKDGEFPDTESDLFNEFWLRKWY